MKPKVFWSFFYLVICTRHGGFVVSSNMHLEEVCIFSVRAEASAQGSQNYHNKNIVS